MLVGGWFDCVDEFFEFLNLFCDLDLLGNFNVVVFYLMENEND